VRRALILPAAALGLALAAAAALLLQPTDPAYPSQVILIGLDGVTWTVLEPLIEAGRTPTLGALGFTGIRGVLDTPGGGSPAKWTTMATGIFPERHGINGFQIFEGERMEPLRSYHRRVEAVWNWVSRAGRSVGVVNYLLTWPPEEVQGYMVTMKQHQRCYPPDLPLDHDTDGLADLMPSPDCPEQPRRQLEEYLQRLDEAFSLAAALRRRQPTDLFIAYTHSTDAVEHRYWKYMEPAHFDADLWELDPRGIECFAEAIPNVLVAADRLIERILEGRPEDSVVLVVSDHGMRPVTPEERNPTFLYDELYRDLGLQTRLADGRLDTSRPNLVSVDPIVYDRREWARLLTPPGTPPEERAGLLSAIAERLAALTVEPGGRPLFGSVHLRQDDERLPLAPDEWDLRIEDDLAVKQAAGELELVLDGQRRPLSAWVRPKEISGTHEPQGIFIATGPGIRNTNDRPYLHGADIAPTLTYLLGLPIPQGLDGRVMTEIFEPEWLASHPIRQGAPLRSRQPRVTPRPNGRSGRSEEESREIEELRALGYVR
jgi:predicted AlkP superfamily phosphohydrolase/phosphomutase